MGIIVNPQDWDDWRWSGRGRPTGSNQPTFAQLGTTGMFAWRFTSGSQLYFSDLQLPHDYKEGTDLYPHVHFTVDGNAETEAGFELEWVEWLSAGDNIPMGGPFDPIFIAGGVLGEFVQGLALPAPGPGGVVIPGANRKISSIIHARLTLVSLTGEAAIFLNGIDAHYQKDRFGSRNAFSK